MANFCALITQNLRPKTPNINWTSKSSLFGDFDIVLTYWCKALWAGLQVRKMCAKIYLCRVPSYLFGKKVETLHGKSVLSGNLSTQDATRAHSTAGFFKSKSTGVDSPPHIELSARAGSGPFAPPFCLLTLWHLICIQFSMLPLGKLKNCLELEKTGQLTHLPSQTIREQTPCFPITIVHIEEEMN